MTYFLLFISFISIFFMQQSFEKKIEGIDTYHISRVNQANRRIEELEDRIRDLEWEVEYK